MADLIIKISYEPMFEPAELSGEICIYCGEPIFGVGFKVVAVVSVEGRDLPGFVETTANYCQSCKPDLITE